MKDLNTAQAQLDEKQRELDLVQAEYDKAMKHKQELVDDAERCRRKMNAASALISGLGGEKERWTEQSKEFKAQIGRYEIKYNNVLVFNMIEVMVQVQYSTKLVSNSPLEVQYCTKLPFISFYLVQFGFYQHENQTVHIRFKYSLL